MNVFIIATESGIQVEVKNIIRKELAKKAEKHFSEVKDFVEDIDNNMTVSIQNGTLVIGAMLPTVVNLTTISEVEEKMKDSAKRTANFIHDLPDDAVNVPAEEQNEDQKKFDDIFEMFKKSFSKAGIFMMVFNPKEHGVHFAGNMNKDFVLSTLLAVDEDS